MADADITTNLGRVRYNIGDATLPYKIEDSIINFLLGQYSSKLDEIAIWRATIDALTILKGRYAHEASRRRESEGSVTVEDYQNERYEAICDLLDYWKSNPPDVANPSGVGLFVFGGVSEKEMKRVENDPDSVLPGVKITRNDDEELEDTDFILGERD